MAVLYLNGFTNSFSWEIGELSSDFSTENGYVAAGISTRAVSSGASSVSGVVDSIEASPGYAYNYTTTNFVFDYPEGTYTFYGWTQTANGKYYPAGSATVEVFGETTVYYITVAYDANGGSGAPGDWSDYSEGSSSFLFTISSTAPVRPGYVFDGWLLDGTTTIYQPGRRVRLSGDPDGVTYVFIAQWTKIQVYYATLEFDANGGTGAPDSITGYSEGSSTVAIKIPATAPSRKGYSFAGWEVTYSGGSSLYQPGNTANLVGTTGGITYTALATWEEVEATGGVWLITASGWTQATVYLYTIAGWVKALPCCYTANGWQQCI